MIRGTTPSITFSFSKVNVADITTIYLTVKSEKDQLVLEMALEDATVDTEANTISWDLSQADTLAMSKNVHIQIRYKAGSKAYASKTFNVPVEEILKEGVI